MPIPPRALLTLLALATAGCLADSVGPQHSEDEVSLARSPGILVTVWHARRSLPVGVRAAAAVSDGARIYVIAGNAGSSSLTNLNRIYDPRTNRWTLGAPIPTALDFTQAASLPDGIHVVSGISAGGLTNQHWVYSRANNSWNSRAPVPVPVDAAVAVGFEGKLYLIGGGSANGPSALVQIYDPISDSWGTGAPMPTARLSTGFSVLQGQIYVAGGQTVNIGTTAAVERYDPRTNSWQTLANLPAPREALGGGTSGETVCVFGGRIAMGSPGGVAFPETYCYSPAANRWRQGPDMLTPRVEAAFASFRGKIYAIGGRTETSFAVIANEALR